MWQVSVENGPLNAALHSKWISKKELRWFSYVIATQTEVGGMTGVSGKNAFLLYEEKFKCTSKPCDCFTCLASQRL